MLNNAIRCLKDFSGSLRFKLSFYAGYTVFLMLVAFMYYSLTIQEQNLVQERVTAALKDSEVIKAAIWNGMMTKDREVIREIVKAIGEQEGFKEINIYDREGVLHYTSRTVPGGILGSRVDPEANPLLKDIATRSAVRYEFSEAGKILNVVNPLPNTKSCSTSACHAHPESHQVLGALEVKMPLEGLRRQLVDNARRIYIFAFFLFLFVSTIIGLGVIFLISRPLRDLAEQTFKMARGEYEPQPPRKGKDSISTLWRSFDAMSRQINERTRELEQSRRMYKELFEKVPCYLTVIDRDYRIVRSNEAFEEEFGNQLGMQCFTGKKGKGQKCLSCPVERTFSDGLSHRSEEIWCTANKAKTVHVIVNTAPIYDDTGNVSEVLEMSVDVTRIAKLQVELEKKQAELQHLIENVPCYLTVVDRSYRIAFFNKSFAEEFGNSWGKHCYSVYKGRDVKCEYCPVEQTFLDGHSHSSEQIWSHGGKEVYMVAHTSPISDEKGEVTAVMEMCTDVTEVKLLQNELAVLGETVAGMSHAVKNILSGLEGGVYVVDSGLRTENQAKISSGWAMVKKNVSKVSDLVKDILYASKERKPEYQSCDPAKILSEVYDLYLDQAEAKGIALIRDFPTELSLGVIDPKGIHSAIANLISNAIVACCEDPEIEERWIKIGAWIEDGNFIVSVRDNGPGMPEEVRQNLFKKFFSTKGSRGTGLGLVVTRKVIEEHGGTIWVESSPGQGTEFFIRVPLRPDDGQHVAAL
jgi:PAS domain S-box-containing protein